MSRPSFEVSVPDGDWELKVTFPNGERLVLFGYHENSKVDIHLPSKKEVSCFHTRSDNDDIEPSVGDDLVDFIDISMKD